MVQWLLAFTRNGLRKHYQLVPLLASIGGGALLAACYTLRLATRNPDVSWNKKTNPEPWQKLGTTGQYKLYAVNVDYKDLKPPADRPVF